MDIESFVSLHISNIKKKNVKTFIKYGVCIVSIFLKNITKIFKKEMRKCVCTPIYAHT